MYRIVSFPLLLIILCMHDVQAATPAQEACQTALSRGQYAQAISHAEQAPQQPTAWLCKGRAQSALSQWAAAQQSYERAIALQPTEVDLISAYMLLGNLMREQAMPSSAIPHYQQAQQLSQQARIKRYEMLNHHLIGEAWFEANQFDKALAAFQAGEKLAMNDNERADSFAHEATAYHALGQLDQAIAYQLKAVLMQQKAGTPDQYAQASLTLGQYFSDQRDWAGAEKTYLRLLDFAQANGGVYYEAQCAIALSSLKQAQGNLTAANHWWSQAEKLAQQVNDPELTAALAKAKPIAQP